MATVGAELQTLRDLHKTFTQKAQEASDTKTAIDNGVNSAVWNGKYADQFRNDWQEYRKNLDTLQQAFDGAATDVKTNHNNVAAATGEGDRI
ncbi:WXG100 family type VII secretion target [Saxibacter everestensis]|uniref:WXG100 family type VII secretion target n=1 Tax=Saxibacter everestensis TaxID=2909229 RepID=A0ABY8QUF0_9MICO|nr:WXG100 family type VII secretion target [Brevibacteriaceae bacterium ZFBP1038]